MGKASLTTSRVVVYDMVKEEIVIDTNRKTIFKFPEDLFICICFSRQLPVDVHTLLFICIRTSEVQSQNSCSFHFQAPKD
jgi:hypothetical protein